MACRVQGAYKGQDAEYRVQQEMATGSSKQGLYMLHPRLMYTYSMYGSATLAVSACTLVVW